MAAGAVPERSGGMECEGTEPRKARPEWSVSDRRGVPIKNTRFFFCNLV